MEFYIPETKETIKAKHRPIVIITSTRKRSCRTRSCAAASSTILNSPTSSRWKRSSGVHFDHVDETLLMQAMQAFYYIRSIDSVGKKPSTSELVDWIRALELTGRGHVPASRRRSRFIGVLLKKDKDISTVRSRLRR